ncbi:4163_t:CDS:2, partial [Gigaspora rosea]
MSMKQLKSWEIARKARNEEPLLQEKNTSSEDAGLVKDMLISVWVKGKSQMLPKFTTFQKS